MRWHGLLTPTAIAALALAAAGCGSSTNQPAAAPKTQAPAKQTPAEPTLKLTVVAPAAAAAVRTSHVAVRGTVVPADAQIQVVGKPARVSGGLFSADADLEMGQNSIDIVATAPGVDPVTRTVSVTRGRTLAQLAAAKRRHKAAASVRRAATARKADENAARATTKVSVPDEVGQRLDVAEDDLHSRALRYTEVGGGAFGIVVPSNWTVCETRPAAGVHVAKHTHVKLIVDREC